MVIKPPSQDLSTLFQWHFADIDCCDLLSIPQPYLHPATLLSLPLQLDAYDSYHTPRISPQGKLVGENRQIFPTLFPEAMKQARVSTKTIYSKIPVITEI